MVKIPDGPVERAEAVAAATEDTAAGEALTELVGAYRKLRGHYNYVCAEGHPDPWPPPPPLDEADPVQSLPRKWRTEAETLRGHGADSIAAVCDKHADELELSVRGDAVRDGVPIAHRMKVVDDGDRMLRVEEAADILGVDKRWLYDRSDTLPFAKKLAPQTLRFSERGLRHWLAMRP